MTLKDRWKRIQQHIGAVADGAPNGPNTVGKLEQALKLGAIGTTAPVADSKLDARTQKNIQTLHAQVQPIFAAIALAGKRIAKRMGAGDYKMISGTRTYAEQNKLYAQGRTAPGRKVTNAKAGQSNHNFGIAGDFGAFGTDGSYLDGSDPGLAARIHKAVAAWAKDEFPGEIEWGGDWKSFPDIPHFQYINGLSMAQMRARVKAGKSVV